MVWCQNHSVRVNKAGVVKDGAAGLFDDRKGYSTVTRAMELPPSGSPLMSRGPTSRKAKPRRLLEPPRKRRSKIGTFGIVVDDGLPSRYRREPVELRRTAPNVDHRHFALKRRIRSREDGNTATLPGRIRRFGHRRRENRRRHTGRG